MTATCPSPLRWAEESYTRHEVVVSPQEMQRRVKANPTEYENGGFGPRKYSTTARVSHPHPLHVRPAVSLRPTPAPRPMREVDDCGNGVGKWLQPRLHRAEGAAGARAVSLAGEPRGAGGGELPPGGRTDWVEGQRAGAGAPLGAPRRAARVVDVSRDDAAARAGPVPRARRALRRALERLRELHQHGGARSDLPPLLLGRNAPGPSPSGPCGC